MRVGDPSNKAMSLLATIRHAFAEQDFVFLYHSFNALVALEETYKKVPDESFVFNVLAKLRNHLDTVKTNVVDLSGRDESSANAVAREFAFALIRIGRVLDGFPPLKVESADIIRQLLDGCCQQSWGAAFIVRLGLILDRGDSFEFEDDTRVGAVLVRSLPHFRLVRTILFNKRVVKAPAGNIISRIRTFRYRNGGSKMLACNNDVLVEEFERYNDLFERFLYVYLPDGSAKLIQKVFVMVKEVGVCTVKNWSDRVKAGKVTEIVAGVFATLTITKSGDSYFSRRQCDEAFDPRLLLFKPHNMQVIAILRLLGIGTTTDESLASHMLQIRTGEGKSIILGVLSVVLALLGFRVRCVCHSKHLSERSSKKFRDFFAAFQVSDRIKYSTIADACWDELVGKGDIRQLTKDLFKGPPYNRKFNGSVRFTDDEILLVDDVDVFYAPDFYGRTRNYCVSIQDSVFDALICQIWNRRNERPGLENVRTWQEYKDVVKKFPMWGALLDTQVQEMCLDVRFFKSPPYEVDHVNGRIGYRKNGSVCWYTRHGYRTAFAFLHEQESGGVQRAKEAVIRDEVSLGINCARLSYAPTSTRILGVTGTLGSSSETEMGIMSRCGIDTFTYLPSLFGYNNLVFDRTGRDIAVETDKSRYFQFIATEIRNTTNQGGAVLVFFETDSRLAEFRKTAFWHVIRHGNVLTTSTTRLDREYMMNKAATSMQATITTTAFARTNFVCNDPQLENTGGLRVVQTFLSMEKSEEVRIMGRTARQGKRGSYCLVLFESDLTEKFGIGGGECAMQATYNLYEWLDKKRESAHARKLSDMSEEARIARQRDQETRLYLNALVKKDYNNAKRLLESMNGVKIVSSTR